MKFGPRTLIFLSGLIWLMIGIFLLSLGSNFIIQACNAATIGIFSKASLIPLLKNTIKDISQVAVVELSFALFLGYLKGRAVFSKTVHRQVERIRSLPSPIPLAKIYTRGYYFLIAGMIGLGMSMRFLPIGSDIRGIVDVAVGMALISGALQYFRQAISFTPNVEIENP